jgi:hypothetical protein
LPAATQPQANNHPPGGALAVAAAQLSAPTVDEFRESYPVHSHRQSNAARVGRAIPSLGRLRPRRWPLLLAAILLVGLAAVTVPRRIRLLAPVAPPRPAAPSATPQPLAARAGVPVPIPLPRPAGSESRPRHVEEETASAGTIGPADAIPPSSAEQGNGSVILRSSPWARILVDGTDIGRTTSAAPFKLPLGRHDITLINPELKLRRDFEIVVRTDIPVRRSMSLH